MKKLLLIISLFISSFAYSQPDCTFTYSNAGALNVVSFLPLNILMLPYHYSWNFGDGVTSHNVDPVHTYNSTGTFTVCLSVYYDTILASQCCQTILISNPAGGGCSFSWDTLGSNAVTFYAQADTSGSTIHWDFGDGQTDTGSVNTHTYASPGTYLVCMHETDGVGTVLCEYCYHVTVGTISTTCSFSYSSDTSSTFVQFFANVATGSTVTWHYGDGTTGSGIDPHHTYNAPGTYVVCITSVYNGVTCEYCDSVVTGANSVGSCSFVYSNDPIHPELVHFEASGIGALGNTFTWSFGDGTSGHGVSESHQYSSSGTYQVCLTVTDSITGTILCQTCEPVTVTGGPATCIANFISTSLGLTAYFIDLSNLNSATTYHWSFGDGSYSDAHFPHHTYAASGDYNVCLTVSSGGCQSTTCLLTTVDSVITTTNCQANFAILQINPFEFVVVNLSSGVNIHFHWDFGDGETSDTAYPSHYYSTIGTYLLCLTVSDFIGCSSTYCDTLSVDSLGNIAHRGLSGFTINIVSPSTLTGVQEISSPTIFSLYPNPVSSELHVSMADELKSTVSYTVYALDGREVATGNFTKKDNVMDVSGWNSGAYILEMRNAEGFKSHQKIIKE